MTGVAFYGGALVWEDFVDDCVLGIVVFGLYPALNVAYFLLYKFFKSDVVLICGLSYAVTS